MDKSNQELVSHGWTSLLLFMAKTGYRVDWLAEENLEEP